MVFQGISGGVPRMVAYVFTVGRIPRPTR